MNKHSKESPEQILEKLPKQLGSFLKEKIVFYERSSGLGASITYANLGGTAVTVYVFDSGHSIIQEGVESEIIRKEMRNAIESVELMTTVGKHKNVKTLKKQKIKFSLIEEKSIDILMAEFNYDTYVDKGTVPGYYPVFSSLYVTGARNYVFKIRATRHLDVSDEEKWEIQTVLKSIFINLCGQEDVVSEWTQVYEDSKVSIAVNKRIQRIGNDTVRFMFNWKWTELRDLKMTPGVSYKSRIELMDINFSEKKYKTVDVKLYDESGEKIIFDETVPSDRWDYISPGSIIDEIFDKLSDMSCM